MQNISTNWIKTDFLIVSELNGTYERYNFNLRNQRSDESIDEYVTELKHLSKNVISVIACAIAYYVIIGIGNRYCGKRN